MFLLVPIKKQQNKVYTSDQKRLDPDGDFGASGRWVVPKPSSKGRVEGSKSDGMDPMFGESSETTTLYLGCFQPKIGVGVFTPPNHPFVHRDFHEITPSILGENTPIFGLTRIFLRWQNKRGLLFVPRSF